MKDIFSIAILSLLWLVNLFNGTGLDYIYKVTDIAKYTVIILFCISFFLMLGDKKKRMVDKKEGLTFASVAILFILVSFFNGRGFSVIDYLWVYMLIFLIGQLKISKFVFFWTGIIYGSLGALVLVIFNFGTLFAGWNTNSIAMLGMHSFLVLIVLFFKSSHHYMKKIMLIIITGVYAYLIFPTDSRSCILFMFVGAMFAINFIPQKAFIGSKNKIIFILLVPLLIAVAVVLISGTPIADKLNVWSIEEYNKPIFNGRDTIWLNGFKMLLRNFLFGIGNLSYANWHNSAIACLTAFGFVGFILWINSFYQIINPVNKYLDDKYAAGMTISFLVLYIQQAVELGFISLSPSVLPYVMLGMLVSRLNYLEEKTQLRIQENK